MRRLLYAAVVLGLLVSVLGVLLQGASAVGRVAVGFAERRRAEGHAGKPLRHRVGGARAGLAGARRCAAARAGARARRSRATLRAGETTLSAAPPRWLLALLALGGAYLAITPALAGHASIESPTGVFFASDVLHVLVGERVGRRDRVPAARAAGRDARARRRRSRTAAAGGARALLAAGARRGGRDRGHGRRAGVHRRAQPARPAAQHIRRAGARQGRRCCSC